ncbi:MAG TPA: molybdenum cofactor biosynthesis protein MoaE [Novosphingobium sp.]|nr:molybdenum cofactor biosynthesis protein MoaE [Novosphingobium sp.]
MIELTRDVIDYHRLTESVRRPGCGAVVVFLGTVRDLTGEQVTVALDYEAYPAMAEKKMAEIEAEDRFGPDHTGSQVNRSPDLCSG